jgi:hypothetical protein
MNNTWIPSSPEDFERQLLAEPNNSFVWIQFMAHCIKNVDIVGARAVAERALRTINFREEDVRAYCVWDCVSVCVCLGAGGGCRSYVQLFRHIHP